MKYWFEESGYVPTNGTLVETNPVLAGIYIAGMAVTFIVGTGGNIMALAAIYSDQFLRSAGNVLLVNLAVADLNVCSINCILCVAGVILGEAWFIERPYLCDLFASYTLISYYSSLLSIGAVSFNRFVHICHFDHYRRIFTTRNTVAMAAVIWVVSFLVDIPQYFGWSYHCFDVKLHFCSFGYRDSLSYTLTTAILGVMVPCNLIIMCYMRIFKHVRQSKLRVTTEGSESARSRQESMKLAGTLFALFVCFNICWLPFLIAGLVNFALDVPDYYFVIFMFMAHCNSTINVILYGLTNSHYRTAFLRFLRLDRYLHMGGANGEASSSISGPVKINVVSAST